MWHAPAINKHSAFLHVPVKIFNLYINNFDRSDGLKCFQRKMKKRQTVYSIIGNRGKINIQVINK